MTKNATVKCLKVYSNLLFLRLNKTLSLRQHTTRCILMINDIETNSYKFGTTISKYFLPVEELNKKIKKPLYILL